MTTFDKMSSLSPTYGESENFHDFALEIREVICQEILIKAASIAKTAALNELEAFTKADELANEGISTLKDRLITAGFNNQKHSTLFKLFIDTSSTYFLSPYQLSGKLEKILLRQSE